MQRAAVAFVEKLQGADRVKVISFDERVHELSDFTSDRALLKAAIDRTVSGEGTKLYDAIELALSSFKPIRGRKAIVLFTDGVDWTSEHASFDSTLHWLDEEGVIVYPIRYETRAEAEEIVRKAMGDANELPTIEVVRRPPSGTTAPTFPSDDPDSVPTSGQTRRTGPLGLPPAGDILRGRRQGDPDTGRYPSPDRLPPTTDPNDRSPLPDGRRDTNPFPDSRDSTRPSSRGSRRRDDSISVSLDHMYMKADTYLGELAKKSGGRLLRADTIGSLPDAFSKIAAELRTQYAVGYYPTNKARDGQYRKIKVTTTRKNVVVRARPGYRAPGDE
jgi:von Willebrand factor type A domain